VSTTSASSRFPRVPLPGSLAGLYGYASGTSFASPEVAGAAALVWAANPLLDAAGVADVLKQSASSHGVWTPELGWGVLDVASAVARATGTPTQVAGSALTLSAEIIKQPTSTASVRSALIVATLHASQPGVDAGARPVGLETLTSSGWGQPVASATQPTGQATWKLRLRRGTYRLRALWAGAGDLAGSVSPTLVLKVS
jgi:hypothetical protein